MSNENKVDYFPKGTHQNIKDATSFYPNSKCFYSFLTPDFKMLALFYNEDQNVFIMVDNDEIKGYLPAAKVLSLVNVLLDRIQYELNRLQQ